MRTLTPFWGVAVATYAVTAACARSPEPATPVATSAAAPAADDEIDPAPGGQAQQDDDERYRARLVASMSRMHRARAPKRLAVEGASFEIGVVRHRAADEFVIVFTAGLGLSDRPTRPNRVELLIEAERFDPRLPEVLQVLAEDAMARPRAWQPYEAIALSQPIHGRKYFDVRPGGALKVAPVGRVQLFKVFPIDREAYETEREPDRGSQWVDEDAADPDAEQRVRARWSEWTEGERRP